MVNLELSTLTVVKRADLVGRDEPMVWTMFIELGIATLNSHQFVVKTDPIAGKLAKAGKGDTINIPASVGRYHRDGGGIFFVGAGVIAFDNDLRTDAQIRNGYNAGAAALNQAILDHFATKGFAPIDGAEQAEINTKISAAITEAFLEESTFRTLFGGKAVGGGTFTREQASAAINENISLTLKPKNERAIYGVKGKMQFQPA